MQERPPVPTLEQFTRIARAIAPTARVISNHELSGGTSCRMDVLELMAGSGQTRQVIVRQYALWHQDEVPHPGVFESAALGVLRENLVPVPALVLGEEITSKIMGRPAIVTSLIDGRSNVNPVDRERWIGQLIEAISRVHSVRISEQVRSVIPSQYDRYHSWFSADEPPAYIARHPLGTALWSKLKRLWPLIDKSAHQLIHADYWAGNTLWEGERLVAIIDWEQPRIGEPTFDVADLIQDASCFGIDIEQSAIEQYERVSGRSLRDYGFWRMAVALGEMGDMPNPVEWAVGFVEMGGASITAREIGAFHANSVERMLGWRG